MAILQRGDWIFTADSNSRISRLICRWDHGPWSHIGTYTGDGSICEAIPPRVAERPIDVYRNPRYRLGIYRHKGMTADETDERIAWDRRQVGKPYAYRKALRLALWKLIRGRPGKGQDAFLFTPNDVAYLTPGLELIHLV
jgi:hypothetical protein